MYSWVPRRCSERASRSCEILCSALAQGGEGGEGVNFGCQFPVSQKLSCKLRAVPEQKLLCAPPGRPVGGVAALARGSSQNLQVQVPPERGSTHSLVGHSTTDARPWPSRPSICSRKLDHRHVRLVLKEFSSCFPVKSTCQWKPMRKSHGGTEAPGGHDTTGPSRVLHRFNDNSTMKKGRLNL